MADDTPPENSGTVRFTVALSDAAIVKTEIPFTVSGDVSSADYDAPASPISIAAGDKQAIVDIVIIDDGLDEFDEELTLELGSSALISNSGVKQSIVIEDDDQPPTISFGVAQLELAEDAGSTSVTLELARSSGKTVSGSLVVTGGADSPSDYGFTQSGAFSFAPGTTSKLLTFQIADDSLAEADETIELSLSGLNNTTGGANDTAVITIKDNDSAAIAGFTQPGVIVNETDATIQAEVKLSSPQTNPVQITFQSSGQADFVVTTPSPLTIPAGQMSGFIELQQTDDDLDELDETFELELISASGDVSVGPQSAWVATALDDDEAPIVQFESPGGAEFQEDVTTLMVSVSLSEPSGRNVTVIIDPLLTGANDAIDPDDYRLELPNGQLEIPAGTIAKSAVITVINDSEIENDEVISLTLSAATNATLGTALGFTAIIKDNDVEPEVAFVSNRASGGTGLFITDFAGTRIVEIVAPAIAGGEIEEVKRSPDGEWFALSANRVTTAKSELYVIPTRGGTLTNVSGSMTPTAGGVSQFEWAPDSSQLWFIANKLYGSRDELYSTKLDGSAPTRISNIGSNQREVLRAEWKPMQSGSAYVPALAYVADEGPNGQYELFVALADGSSNVNVSKGTLDTLKVDRDDTIARGPSFAWAPNASRIAFRATVPGVSQFRLFSVLPSGSDRRRLSGVFAVATRDVEQFRWSPDSSSVVFAAQRDSNGTKNLFAADPIQSDVSPSITGFPEGQRVVHAFAFGPWAGPGDPAPPIAYVANDDLPGRRELYSVTLAGPQTKQRLNSDLGSDNDVFADFVSWSPDGSRVAFLAKTVTLARELFTADANGAGSVRISKELDENAKKILEANWAPDGSELLYVSDQDSVGRYDVFRAPSDQADGWVKISNVAPLGTAFDARWADNGSKILYIADETVPNFNELFLLDGPVKTTCSGNVADGEGVIGYGSN